ncbi:hypothetical protein WJX72_011107 [[Myrmecia] bisecta]|uniref:Protein SYS1 homolog n=1 Tax=[Myrmecia] bisecta TaxID=41462 RepID=A0AAW1QGC6_9CHLO
MFYGSQGWDPVLIVAQICTVQCLHYLSLGVFLWLLCGPYVGHLTLQQLFVSNFTSFHSFVGWMAVLASLVNSLASAVYLMFVVERAKKCLDFAATIYIIHLACCCIYKGFPTSVDWWAVNITAMIVTALLGEFLCMHREMQDIPIGSWRSRRSGTTESQIPLTSIASTPMSAFRNTIFGQPNPANTASSRSLTAASAKASIADAQV